MRLLIASDIHGDSEACGKILAASEFEKVQKTVLLGDLLYHGPRNPLPEHYDPKSVISMLNKNKNQLLCVRGNCDTEVDSMVLDFPILSEYSYIYDGEINLNIFLTHGHIYSPEKLPSLDRRTAFLYGHTHIFGINIKNNIPCLNPGSVSLPKGGHPQTYMLYDTGNFFIKDFNGNILLNFFYSNQK